jgi:hypothetical protein
MGDLLRDVFTECRRSRRSEIWPSAEYIQAAKACAADSGGLEKLRALCNDLETVVNLLPGPGTFYRAAKVPRVTVAKLEGRSWSEILLDDDLDRTVWIGIRNFGNALKSVEMDTASRRTGAVLHAIAVKRLESLGEFEASAAQRQADRTERNSLLKKPYVTATLKRILDA